MSSRHVRILILLVAFAVAASGQAVVAQAAAPPDGKEVYDAICATCHGPDGRGETVMAETIPLPDFSDCSFARREPDSDWVAVGHGGGRARGFSPLMPPWLGTLSSEEITAAVGHLRTFCTDDRWPRGELNLPLLLVTGKAFPEDEAVVTFSSGGSDRGRVLTRLIYERRIGPVDQVEVAVPFTWAEGASDDWAGGIGDVALGYKRVLAHSLARGNIVSASAEVVVPTGSEKRGLGSGTTVFEPFLTFGQIVGGDGFLQAQAGFELPVGADRTNEAFWRIAAGKSFAVPEFGRTWSPAVELLGSRAFEEGALLHWDVVPQVQITLNKRQHIRVSGGVRIPVSHREGRSATFMTYLLWDWFDGGFLDGW